MNHKPDFTLPKDGKIGMDTLRVRPADAIDRMAYHLRLASMYYEAAPDKPETEQAFTDAMLDEIGSLGKQDPAWDACREFFKWIKFGYEKLKRETDDD